LWGVPFVLVLRFYVPLLFLYHPFPPQTNPRRFACEAGFPSLFIPFPFETAVDYYGLFRLPHPAKHGPQLSESMILDGPTRSKFQSWIGLATFWCTERLYHGFLGPFLVPSYGVQLYPYFPPFVLSSSRLFLPFNVFLICSFYMCSHLTWSFYTHPVLPPHHPLLCSHPQWL